MTAPLSIKLRCASWQQLSAIYRRDLSRNAMFLRSSNPPPLGTPVRIDLTLPSDSMVVLTGVVHEMVPTGGLEGRGPGVDIQLQPIPPSAMWLIETALSSATKGQSAMSQISHIRSVTQPQAQPPGQPQATPPPEPVPEPPRPTRDPTEAGLEDGSEWADAEDELLAALTAEHESLRKLNAFQVLGLGYEAGDADVRRAFGELTKRYHPDRFARYPSQELRRHAAEIFILIRDAYRRLGDDKGRQQVLAQIGPRVQRPGPAVRLGTPPPVSTAAGPPPPPGAASPPAPAGGPSRPPPPPRAATPPLRPGPPPAPGAPPPGPPGPIASPTAATTRLATVPGEDGRTDTSAADALIEQGKYDEALAVYKIYARKHPGDRIAKAGIELAEGLRSLAQRDRLEAAQRFESVLELDPSNERAARELAEMRRQATNERKGLLTRLLGKKE
jgi:tetratricopeptide (TPR) repeat protein